jgi:hypothetical protein
LIDRWSDRGRGQRGVRFVDGRGQRLPNALALFQERRAVVRTHQQSATWTRQRIRRTRFYGAGDTAT